MTGVIVAALVVLVAGRPVLLDRCVLACAHATTAPVPSCHQAAADPLDTRVDAAPPACGHDHSAVLLGANTAAAHDPLVTGRLIAATPAYLPPVPSACSSHADRTALTSPSALRDAAARPLRI
jgi:hypothetical protein